MVQLLTLYTEPERHKARRYITDERTDDIMTPIADHTVYFTLAMALL